MYLAPHPIPTPSSYATVAYLERALGVGSASSSTPNLLAAESTSSSATSTSTSEEPFFTSGSIDGQSGSDSGSSSGSGGQGSVTKTALEWVFAIAALLAIASITTWRYTHLRRKNQSMLSFLPRPRNLRSNSSGREDTQERRRSLPRTTGLPRARTMSGDSLPIATTLFYPPSLSHGRYPILLEPASAHLTRSASLSAIGRGRDRERRSRRAAQGADIDAYGRRGGRPGSDDLHGDDKDELPVYESVAIGGPPRYGDGDLHFLGGVPLRILALPVIHNSTPETISLEREREVERALQRIASEESTESSSSPSPNRRHHLESATPVDSPASRASHHANAPASSEAHSVQVPTFSSNFQPC